MKPVLKYVFCAFLFLFCFSAVLPAAAASDEDIYALLAIFAGADMGNEERAPSITIIIEDGSEVDLWVMEDTSFMAMGEATLAQFAELFVGYQVTIEFVVRGDEYFLIECALVLVM